MSYVSVLKYNPNHDKTGRFAAGKSTGGTLHFRKLQAKPQPSQGGLLDLLEDLLIGNRRKPTPKKPGPVVQIRKFNKCHDEKSGRFDSECGAGGGSKASASTGSTGSKRKLTPDQEADQARLAKQNAKPVHTVKTAEEAVALILKGENVEIQDTKQIHTILKKLGQLAIEAKAAEQDAKNWDPCTITVKGVSLFCTEKIKTEDFPHGIPRIEMPQFKSKNPVPGSAADKLPKNAEGEVDATQAFLDHLSEAGVKSDPNGTMLARKLKASQAEMEGVKVAGMMIASEQPGGRDPKKAKITVTSDGYVLDGHHTWAAAVGRDAEDGNLDNDMEMEVVIVDMPMSKVYHEAVAWTEKYGLPKAGVKKREGILTAWLAGRVIVKAS